MQELISSLKEKAGLNDDQALAAIKVMQEYIHSKVPPMFSAFVDNFFTGNSGENNGDFMP